jgi:hypothetical protein
MLIKERKLRSIIRKILIEKKFHQLPGYAKNKEIEIYDALTDPTNDDLRNDVFDIIDSSYAYLGGNADIKAPEHLMDPSRNDYIYFKGWDIDSDPEADVVRGMKPKAGKIKLALSATDGSGAAKEYGVSDTTRRLLSPGNFAEMSGAAAVVQFKVDVPAFTDEASVRSNLPGKEIIWFGEHPYFSSDEELLAKGVDPEIIRELSIEARKSKQYGPNGEYDGWYVRILGGEPHAKIMLGTP